MILCEQSNQTNKKVHEEVMISRSPKEEDPSHEEITKEIASPLKDPSYVPSKHDELSGDSNSSECEEDSKRVNPQNEIKFLVFKEQMDKLLKRCPECGAAIRKKHTLTKGILLLVTLKCINGPASAHLEQLAHADKRNGSWKSFDVLYNSTIKAELPTLAEILRLCFLSDKTFYSIQNFPVINVFWQ